MEYAPTAFTVFALMMLTDVVWARYTSYVAAKRPGAAAAASVGIILCGGLVTLAFVSNPWMLVPEALGAWCGTYLSVWWDARK